MSTKTTMTGREERHRTLLRWLHHGGLFLIVVALSWELISRGNLTWDFIKLLAGVTVTLSLLVRLAAGRARKAEERAGA